MVPEWEGEAEERCADQSSMDLVRVVIFLGPLVGIAGREESVLRFLGLGNGRLGIC